jgi:hypothetical protein
VNRDRAPTVVILAAAAAAVTAVVLFGGPRLGYLPGIVFSAIVGLLILGRYQPSLPVRWLVAALLAAYYAGGALMVRGDVLAHVSFSNDVLRYDRGIHVLGGLITVLLVAEIAGSRPAMGVLLVLVVAAAAGFIVEGVELATALALPGVFSYDAVDSSLDVVGNMVGLALGSGALLWAKRRPLAPYRAAGSV